MKGILCKILAFAGCGVSYGEFRSPTRVQYFHGDVAAPPETFTGAPDDEKGVGGAGTTWGGLGDGFVLYDLLRGGTVDAPVLLGDEGGEKLVQQGNGIFDQPGVDLVLYEAIGGAEESHLVRVEVSDDMVAWTDVSSSRQLGAAGLPFISSISRTGEFAASYDISDHGQAARYLRLTGTSNSRPGQTDQAGSGYDLDGVAFAARPPMEWVECDAPGIGSSGYSDIVVSEGAIVGCVPKLSFATRLDLFSREVGRGESYQRVGQTEEGDLISTAKLAAKDGKVWAAMASEEEGRFTVAGYQMEGGALAESPFYSEQVSLPDPINGAGYEVALILGLDDLPVGVVTDGAAEARFFQVRTGEGLRVEVFGSVEDGQGGRSSHTGPAIGFYSSGMFMVGVSNTKVTPDKRYSTKSYVMPVGVDLATGLVDVPVADAGENFIISDQAGDEASPMLVQSQISISGEGKLAFVERNEVLDRIRIVYQLDSNPKSRFGVLLPEGFKDGRKPSVVWSDEETLMVAALIELEGGNPYPVFGEFDVGSEKWRVSGIFDPQLRFGNMVMTLEEGGVPQLSYLSISSPRAVIPEDLSDPDGDGLSILEEAAGLVVEPEIELANERGIRLAMVSITLPGAGVISGGRSYLTDYYEYDVLGTGGLGEFRMENSGVTLEDKGELTRVRYTSVLDPEQWGRRFYRVRVRRR